MCPANEEYVQCGNRCNELSCDFPNGLTRKCAPACDSGCFCIQGTVRNNDGQCVPYEECPIRPCPDNEHYKTCGPGKICEESCNPPNTEECPTNICYNDCYCNEGFVRDASGSCVPKIFCPQQCGKNQEFTLCAGPSCMFDVDTCGRKRLGPRCLPPCRPGCMCQKGFELNSNGECVECTGQLHAQYY